MRFLKTPCLTLDALHAGYLDGFVLNGEVGMLPEGDVTIP